MGAVVNHQPATHEQMAAKRLIEGSVFYAPQAEAGTSGALASWLAKTINTLPGMAGLGISLTTANVTVDQLSAATAGDATLPQGRNGTFRFTAAIGPLTATPSPGTIVASVYQPPSSSSSASSIPSGSASSGSASAGSSSSENTPVSGSFPEAVSPGGASNSTAPAGVPPQGESAAHAPAVTGGIAHSRRPAATGATASGASSSSSRSGPVSSGVAPGQATNLNRQNGGVRSSGASSNAFSSAVSVQSQGGNSTIVWLLVLLLLLMLLFLVWLLWRRYRRRP